MGGWNSKRFRACIKLTKTRQKEFIGELFAEEALEKSKSSTRGISRFCKLVLEVKTPMHLLRECDAVIVNRDRNLGQHHIRREEVPNLEVTQILIFLSDLDSDE